jgi:hypothetical protein
VGADRLRVFESLRYGNPKGFLIALRELERRVTASELSAREKSLRTNELKPWRELRDAALFCHFMAERYDTDVLIAKTEASDYDSVATWERNEDRVYSPIQLKEVVPAELNPNTDVQEIINGLAKYAPAPDLTAAIHLNRAGLFDPRALVIPKLPVRSLWVFGALNVEATRWALVGDLMGELTVSEHHYPAA